MMENILSRDPEEIGPEHPDDLNARMNLAEAIHEYEGDGGPCQAWARKYCYEHKTVDDCQPCGAQKSSVLHLPDPDWHGWECYCYECCQ